MMNWLPALASNAIVVAILGTIGWVSRESLRSWVAGTIQRRNDERIESLRSDFRTSEEEFRANLQSNEAQVAAIRENALAALGQRKAALDQRRLLAADRMWQAVVALEPAKRVARILEPLDVDATFDRIGRASPDELDKLKLLFGTMLSGPVSDARESRVTKAALDRPFVSPLCWALYSAYAVLATVSVLKAGALSMTFDARFMIDEDTIKETLRPVLPEYNNYIEAYGHKSAPHLMDAIETKLIEEMRRMLLEGFETDENTVEQASAILRAAEKAHDAIERANETEA